jgi:hypothetical protein
MADGTPDKDRHKNLCWRERLFLAETPALEKRKHIAIAIYP